jgi:hypothetical protein
MLLGAGVVGWAVGELGVTLGLGHGVAVFPPRWGLRSWWREGVGVGFGVWLGSGVGVGQLVTPLGNPDCGGRTGWVFCSGGSDPGARG